MYSKTKIYILKYISIFLTVSCLSSCQDEGCVDPNSFGGHYATVESNPDAVYGDYPHQSTEWVETGLRTSGQDLRIAISGSWAPWLLYYRNQYSLERLQSCFDRTQDDFTVNSGRKNFGLCAKRVPFNIVGQPLTGIARATKINEQNCICYKGESPVGIRTVSNDATTECDPGNPAHVSDPSRCSCDNTIAEDSGKHPAEGQCVFHYSLADHEKNLSVDLSPDDPPVGEFIARNSEAQGAICKFHKGMGLYMGLFGTNGRDQPHRAYHLFAQEEKCPIVRNSNGECLQDMKVTNIYGEPVFIDRTRYIYSISRVMRDDKGANDCVDIGVGGVADDEYHGKREVIKLKIYDSYYRDNYGSYSVEFLTGIYSDNEVPIMEFVVNLIEEILLGDLNVETGEREGGILRFLYNSIAGNTEFMLIIQILLVLYIAFFGVSSLMGLVEMGRKEMMIRILQVGVVLTFATADGWIMYNDFFIEFFKRGMDEVVNKITHFANVFFLENDDTTSPIRSSQLMSTDPDSMGSKFAYIDVLIRQLFSEDVTKKIWSLFLYTLLGFLYIACIYLLVFYFIYVMSIVAFVYCVTLTKMIIALSLGPIFIVFILFRQTNEYFKKWITFLAARSLEVVILFLIVFILITLIGRKFTELLTYGACIQEWDLWLFKLKFFIADSVDTVEEGVPTGQGRETRDWMIMFANLALILYMTKLIVMQIPQLAGKLVSVGGAANASGGGGSYAQSGYNIASSAMSEAFGFSKGGAKRVAGFAATTAVRGLRKAVKDTSIARSLPNGPRSMLRNAIIDKEIRDASMMAKAKGLSGAKREAFIRNSLLKEAHVDKKKSEDGKGLRDWARKNKASSALLGIDSQAIANRLDQKLVEGPMKREMKIIAESLKSRNPSKMLLGDDLKAQIEKGALEWAKKNSSLDESSIHSMIDKIKGQKSWTGGKGRLSPRLRRVNFFDELSKMHYNEASGRSKFGGSDQAQEKYLSHLKSRQFEKLRKQGKLDNLVSESSKHSNQSQAFVRRAHDKKSIFNFRFRNRDKKRQELAKLEGNAIRSALTGNDFFNEKGKIRARFDDPNSIERIRAASYGEMYGAQVDRKRDEEMRAIDDKRRFFMRAMSNDIKENMKGLKNHPETMGNVRRALEDVVGKYRQFDIKKGGNPQATVDRMTKGLQTVPLKDELKINGKTYQDLSLFEAKAMMTAVGAIGALGVDTEEAFKVATIRQRELDAEIKENQERAEAARGDIRRLEGEMEDGMKAKMQEVEDVKGDDDGSEKAEAVLGELQDNLMALQRSQDQEDRQRLFEEMQKQDQDLREEMNEQEFLDAAQGIAGYADAIRDAADYATEQADAYNAAYQAHEESRQQTDVIVKELDVEFGSSIEDALKVGSEDVLIKAADVSISGSLGQGEQVDTALVADANFKITQCGQKIKMNKNKISYLEYDISNLENQMRTADGNERDALQREIRDKKSEVGELQSSTRRNESQMQDAEFRVGELMEYGKRQ